ncbi:MAG: hypothetical protein ACJ74E_08310 [Actinomycetes bacterium]
MNELVPLDVTRVAHVAVVASDGMWPERLFLTAVVLAGIAVCLVLMRWGWVRRGRRQHDVAELAVVPPMPEERLASDLTDVEARFLGANRTGDWLDRVVVHGLGVPSAALVSVRTAVGAPDRGVWIRRRGAPDIFVSGRDVCGVRHDRAAAGRAYEANGVLVIAWCHQQQALDLGLRVRDPVMAERLRTSIDAFASVSPTTGDSS